MNMIRNAKDALCEPCKADWSNATVRVDAAFDEARGAGERG